MRDLQFQTQLRDQSSANRKQKTVSDLKTNLRKTAKKSFDPVFKASSEDDSTILEFPKEFSEAGDDNPFVESAENFLASVHPAETNSSETDSSETVAVSYVTATRDTSNTKTPKVDSIKAAGSVETEVLMKLPREARMQLLKSKDIGPSKRMLEALINIVIQDFHDGLYEEGEWLDKLLSRRSNLVFLMCIMVAFYLMMVWFIRWISTESFTGPPPT